MECISGKWIVVEGPDRIGKTTLIRKLRTRLVEDGLNVMTNGFPRRVTPIGELLDKALVTRGYVKDWKARTLMFLADMLEAQGEIYDWKSQENGSGVVITDRYVVSTYAYSKAESSWVGPGSVDEEWICNAIGLLPQPDAYIVMVPYDGSSSDDRSSDGSNDGNRVPEFLTRRAGYGTEVTECDAIQQSVISSMDDIASGRYESQWLKDPKVIKVAVGEDDSQEALCDDVVIPRLMRVFGGVGVGVGADAKRNMLVADTMPTLI